MRGWMIVLSLLWAGCGGAAQRPMEALGETMNAARAGERVAQLPAVESLVGLRRSALVAVLGTPRDCAFPLEGPCRSVGETIWVFGGDEHGALGPMLVVRLDEARRVTAASWRNQPAEPREPQGLEAHRAARSPAP